jgi:hypothetical protein
MHVQALEIFRPAVRTSPYKRTKLLGSDAGRRRTISSRRFLTGGTFLFFGRERKTPQRVTSAGALCLLAIIVFDHQRIDHPHAPTSPRNVDDLVAVFAL